MRISDWSSDVCSSDLAQLRIGGAALVADRIAIPHRTANALEFRCALQLRPLARIAVVTAALKPLDRCPANDGFNGRALDLDTVKVHLGLAVDKDFHGLSLLTLAEGPEKSRVGKGRVSKW